jgi:hypothetical protein
LNPENFFDRNGQRLTLFLGISLGIHLLVIKLAPLPQPTPDFARHQPVKLAVKIYRQPPHSPPRDAKPNVKSHPYPTPKAASRKPKTGYKALIAKPPGIKPATKAEAIKPAIKPVRAPSRLPPQRIQPALKPTPALSSRQLLQAIKNLPEATAPPNQHEQAIFLNPKTQALYEEAIIDQQNLPESAKTDQTLTVDDVSPITDGFRYAVINGRCWAVPVEDGFDNSFSTVLMAGDFNCPQKDENPLAQRLEKWIQKNQ